MVEKCNWISKDEASGALEFGKPTIDAARTIKDITRNFDVDKKAEISNVTDKSDLGKIKFDPDEKAEVSKLKIHTRNEGLENDRHPITGVKFERNVVEDADGNKVDGVFPIFDSVCDVKLPKELEQASDKKQFEECNKQLKEKIEDNLELAKKFSPEQLEQIKNNDTPDGYTWHHNEEKGKMQLVDSGVHANTGHTGGKTIWGGGNENR